MNTKPCCLICGSRRVKPDPEKRLYPGYVECAKCGFQWFKGRPEKPARKAGKGKRNP